MIKKYFSTFAAGLEPVIEELLKIEIADVKIIQNMRGLVTYQTESRADTIKRIGFFNNSFQLLQFFPPNKEWRINRLLAKIIKNGLRLNWKDFANKTFRVVVTSENDFRVRFDQKLLTSLENLISRNMRMRVDRRKPQIEFWVMLRDNGAGLFGLRLTKHSDYGDKLDQGELRPEITEVMCLLSEPNKADVFLDPFAGSGAIARARMNYPHSRIIAGDISPKNKSIVKIDATKLETLSDESIDKVVTDPPWGLYDQKVDVNNLYPEMLDSFYRVLRRNGLVVILVGDREYFEKLLTSFMSKFQVINKLHILVSGKKAGVYKLVKI